MFSYTVRCRFQSSDRGEISRQWVQWLETEHLRDVLNAGAESAEIFKMDSDASDVVYEIRYRFASRIAFENYEANHAPRLRSEGLARFPLSAGLAYERTTGESVSSA